MKRKVVVSALVFLIVTGSLRAFGAAAPAPLTNAPAVAKFADSPEIVALLNEADKYSNGEGVKKDPKKAYKLHRKAAEMGSARAQCLLGLDYADGSGVKKDPYESIKWLRMSADQGWPSGQYDLGLSYALGNVPGKTATDAAVWYRKAADQGLPEAEWALGNCYLEGAGVPKDIPEGVRWTRRAAERGFAPAQRVLGVCYVKGNGVTKDLVTAYKWLNLSAARDDMNSDDIRVNLSMAERFMTPEQIAEGQRLAREFKPKAIPAPGHVTPGDLLFDPEPSTTPAARTNEAVAAMPIAVPVAAKGGLLFLKADDESYEIFLDGAFVGNAPAKLKMTEGSHVVEVKKTGYKNYRKQLQIGDGSELTLKVNLEKE